MFRLKRIKKLIYIFSLLAGLLLVLQCTHESISPKEAVELFPETGASPLPFLDGISYRNSPSLSGDTRHKSSNNLDMEVVEELLEKAQQQKEVPL